MSKLARIYQNVLWRLVGCAPISMRLGLRCSLLRRSKSFELEWELLKKLGANRGLALDVGANRGLYSYRLADLYENVIAFEPNTQISRELSAAKISNVELRSVALSSKCGSRELFIPFGVSGQELDGWASFDPNNCSTSTGSNAIEVQVIALDDLSLPSISFIKVDVEGHEVDFLRGALKSLQKYGPRVLIEVRQSTLEDVQQLFNAIGYKQLDLAALLGAKSGNEMYLFAPNETESFNPQN